MTDREMLELAAKAAGAEYTVHHVGGNDYALQIDHRWWVPLTDDGDALRLAVKLGLSVQFGTYKVACEFIPQEEGSCLGVTESYQDDPYAATRLAIVRAAAEIGAQL